MNRVIFHLDVDAFFVSVERLRRPWLRGRPVVVGGDPARRGVVASASYEARRCGIRAGAPLASARRLCPSCVFLPCALGDYAAVSGRLFRILDRYTPDVEPLSIEEAYLDMSGTRLLRGHPLLAAETLRGDIGRETGLASSIGVARNKLTARIASARAKPNGILYVMPGREREFLAPLPVREMPGVGPRTEEALRRMGIVTIGDLAAAGGRLLSAAFGAAGARIAEAAAGRDDDPVSPPAEARSVGRETTFAEDILDRAAVLARLSALVEESCRSLRGDGRQARTVTLKLRYADFATVARSATLAEPTDIDREVLAAAAALLGKTWTRRLKIRLVGVRLSNLTGGDWQPRLIAGPDRARLKRLYAGLDRIREQYGGGAIRAGTSIDPGVSIKHQFTTEGH
ncbi:MAG: DNA polymerase IV [bacterium]|nr:DNA polymerase IV [bacterium]